MNASDGMAPAVRSILAAAQNRSAPTDGPISVTPRSISHAIESAEAAGNVPVIAELKPTSPTANYQREGDPVELATAMVEGGAAALSVLTEPEHFGGSAESLSRIRAAVDVPVLRKDFVLEPGHLDVVESDIILIIVRFVDDVHQMVRAAKERGFQVLVETHNAEEVAIAADTDADLIGINNRDLASLSVDLTTFERVAETVPSDVTLVAESGMQTPADVRRMRAAGADAVLIGSAIMAGEDVTETTRAFVGAEQ